MKAAKIAPLFSCLCALILFCGLLHQPTEEQPPVGKIQTDSAYIKKLSYLCTMNRRTNRFETWLIRRHAISEYEADNILQMIEEYNLNPWPTIWWMITRRIFDRKKSS